ncbi:MULTISPECIES: class 1b ribonucleoside-diphosphate reductase subunit alpha [Paenibacillus]|uniref:class 1b ribonucleoside-diphosphate reductase subunit alpha n=1 Tax=Paenibacillus TaxID=44249 RepID=UPI0003D2B1C0|nr:MULTISPECIES: class 1b ribonucleoside-diphosphate reductase subunit alpha [Paenibacillus]AHC19461.1 ribonucleotide-diphosphate reductase subunit alpha [Paenibacillus polymyxa CR1]APQ58924.1 ribonucleotide-diphosphate reductase subunit alpha [Paenibacillus polymyxa]ODB62240.1 ribonucleotide-diphosphate reductase [Paenibacillus polymyxa]OMF35569.1 ribonucleotide-diphosphate reductase subunit alpha [Paenibacillus peoriae]VUG04079.1 Ribonucleoside-diphosphate reductase 2 subunit alpha [Paenibac
MRHIELNNMLMKRDTDGFFQLEKDQEAVAEFMKEVQERSLKFADTAAQVLYMIENDYYENFYNSYTADEINDIFHITHSYNFKFPSYMAASKFYTDYAMKSNDRKVYLEHYPDRVAAVALHLGRGNADTARLLSRSMMEQRLQPATPTFLNAGKSRRGELVSCFLLEMDDSLNSINYVLNTCMQLSKIGGGVAVNLSKLRARGEAIKGVEGAAKGIMPVLKLMEDGFSYADQMGQRKGSGAAYYNIFGWDVLEFLDSKKINADERVRLKTLSIGLLVPNRFYKLAQDNEPLHVFAPYSVFKAYGTHLDDMDLDEMYDTLLADDRVKKKIAMSARDMLTKIAMIQLESGYPYIMNKSNANQAHALKNVGQVKMSNLCTEIFQLQETSEITDYGQQDTIRRDVSCNLASLNIVNVMEHGKIRESVHEGMIALTSVSDMTQVANAPGVAKANREMHSVGLGVMNLHGYFAKNKIAYESNEAKDFVRTFFMTMNYHSIEKSMEIAKVAGQSFYGFEESDYATGVYFDRYLNTDYRPTTARVQELFKGIYVPTSADWDKLKADVMKNGLYHAYRMAIAPTASISYIQNATSSVMPIVEQIETRTYANSTTYYPMPYLQKDNVFFYKSAYQMDQFKVLDLIAEIQPHVDQGISTVLHVNSDVTTRQLARCYLYAAHKGLKSLYYTRTKKLSVEECLTCSI